MTKRTRRGQWYVHHYNMGWKTKRTRKRHEWDSGMSNTSICDQAHCFELSYFIMPRELYQDRASVGPKRRKDEEKMIEKEVIREFHTANILLFLPLYHNFTSL
jgi:hypothetical protein